MVSVTTDTMQVVLRWWCDGLNSPQPTAMPMIAPVDRPPPHTCVTAMVADNYVADVVTTGAPS